MRLIFLVISFLLATPLMLIWQSSMELIQPQRRELEDYHRDWLQNPGQHGVHIDLDYCVFADTPCLFVQPDAATGPAKRGRLLRQQIGEAFLLPDYGQTRGILVLLHAPCGNLS